MKENFGTKIPASFYLWLDNKITAQNDGFFNSGITLFKQSDSARSNFTCYASPYKSWIYDSCSAAEIPSGFYNASGQYLTRASGLIFDFENGRVLSSADWGDSLTGRAAYKDYNLYFVSENEVDMTLENGTLNNKNVKYGQTGIAPYSYQAPCIFITTASSYNEPFALGGLDNSKETVRLFAISSNPYNQESLKGLLVNSKTEYIPLLSGAQTPFTFYGDLKNDYFNYCDLKSLENCGNGLYISDVFYYKIQNTSKTNTFLISAFDFKLEKIRDRNKN